MTKCTVCISEDIKKALRKFAISAEEMLVLDKLPVCDVGNFNLCVKAARKRSAYQQFVSECMKSKQVHGFKEAAPAMKECAVRWKSQKGVTNVN